jgi:hypothetical protein
LPTAFRRGKLNLRLSNAYSQTAFIRESSAKTRQVGNLCSRNPATEKPYREATRTVRRKMVQKYQVEC